MNLHSLVPKVWRRFWSAQTRRLPLTEPAARPRVWSRAGWRRYAPESLVIVLVMGTVFLVHWRGLAGWPGLVNNDEGIYMSEAWAVRFQGTMAPFTYDYDHPWLGWIQIAGYTMVRDLVGPTATAIIAGREAMLLAHMVTALFLYLLGRRLGLRRGFAGAGVLLFSLSPLALHFQRLVFLDNLAVMGAVIAMWALASPKRSLSSAAVAGISFAAAALSKETIAVLLIFGGLPLMLRDYGDERNAKMRRLFFFGPFVLVAFYYVLYAALKHELFPGPGHVSLLGAVKYQLVGRAASGSLFDPTSSTAQAVFGWLRTEPFLLGAGVLLVPVAIWIQRLRAVALCLLIQVLLLLRHGYLPYAYPTAMFPFAGLVIAGVADRAWSGWRLEARRLRDKWRWLPRVTLGTLRVVLAAVIAVVVVTLAQHWGPLLRTAMTAKPNLAPAEAAAYVAANVPRGDLLVADDDVWVELRRRGWSAFPTFKLDLDPAIHSQLKDGYESIDYLLLTPTTPGGLRAVGLPTVAEALEHSEVVASFGPNQDITLRRVIHNSS